MSISDVEAVVRVAQEATQAEELQPGKVYAFMAGGQVHKVDLTGDEYRDSPRRKVGTTRLGDIDSLAAYLNKHATSATEVYADPIRRVLVAVIDAHSQDRPGWLNHRATYEPRLHPAWNAWTGSDGQWMVQEDFAEHIEANRAWIVEPEAATVMEMVTSFQAKTSASFKSGIQSKSGQKVLEYTEQVQASAGAGKLEIPDHLVLGLPVFLGAEQRYRLPARFQFRINGGRLTMRYVLVDAAEAVHAEFLALMDRLNEIWNRTDGQLLLVGSPG